jgi:acetyl esterase/lipase
MTSATEEIYLWPGEVAPGLEGATQIERDGESPFVGIVRYNVTRPRLNVVRPSGPSSGAAAIICPGGGFHFLTMDNEGTDLATLLAAEGVTCFVLSYRLIATPADPEQAKAETMAAFLDGANKIAPFSAPIMPDGPQAVRIVRQRSAEFGIDPNRISMIGFSAGALLTATTILGGPVDARPNAAAIVYLPGLPPHTAPADAPPLFVVAAVNDQIAVTGNEDLYRSWRNVNRPVEMHLFEKGGHGFGVRRQGTPSDVWPQLFISWLRTHAML